MKFSRLSSSNRMVAMQKKRRGWIPFAWELLSEAGNGFMEHYALRLSAALAYYSVFSLAPLLIISVGIAGALFGEQAVRGQLNAELTRYMGVPTATQRCPQHDLGSKSKIGAIIRLRLKTR